MQNNFLLLFVVIFLLCSCERQADLSDGYDLFRQYGDVHSIASPDGKVIIYGDVNKAYEIDGFILGVRARPNGNEAYAVQSDQQQYGYFILDKDSKSLVLGLSKKEFDRDVASLKSRPN